LPSINHRTPCLYPGAHKTTMLRWIKGDLILTEHCPPSRRAPSLHLHRRQRECPVNSRARVLVRILPKQTREITNSHSVRKKMRN
jgi:hypothetical protein